VYRFGLWCLGQEIRVKGLVEMPTKVLNIIPRKSSYGEGTNTWDKFELRVHERGLTFLAPQMLSSKSPQSPLNLVSRLMSPLLIPKSTCLKKSSNSKFGEDEVFNYLIN